MAGPAFRRARAIPLLVCAFALFGVAAGLHTPPHGPGPTAARPVAQVFPSMLAAGAGDGAGDGGSRQAPGSGAAIGPGAVTETPGAGICTAGFLFTGGGRTFLAQAAHCAGTGPDTETDGCTSSTLRPGVRVVVRGPGGPVTGTLRYSSWTAMQDGGESEPDTCAFNDFALVELPDVPVSPSLPVLGGPAGLRDTPPSPGAPVYGLATPATPTARPGSAGVDEGGGWAHTVRTGISGAPGESGGPLVDGRGMALGVLAGMERGGALEYTDLARAVDYARRHGAPEDLALATGSAPFVPPPR